MTALNYTKATFPPNVHHTTLPLPQADIAIFASLPPSSNARSRKLLLLSHGNSASSLIWKPIFTSPLAQTHTIIAFDLPGHGASSNARDEYGVENVYTQRGYAEVARALLERLGAIDERLARLAGVEVVFVGWSLGGHVGLELCELLRQKPDPSIKISALLLTGTPPIPLGGAEKGFYPTPAGSRPLVETELLTDEEISIYGKSMAVFGPYEDWMRDAVARTDGRARRIMFGSFRDGRDVCDQKELVERLTREGHGDGDGEKGIVVAVVNGAQEPFVNIKWIREGISWGPGLWRGVCVELSGSRVSGHTPFWEDWEGYWPLLRDLVKDVDA